MATIGVIGAVNAEYQIGLPVVELNENPPESEMRWYGTELNSFARNPCFHRSQVGLPLLAQLQNLRVGPVYLALARLRAPTTPPSVVARETHITSMRKVETPVCSTFSSWLNHVSAASSAGLHGVELLAAWLVLWYYHGFCSHMCH